MKGSDHNGTEQNESARVLETAKDSLHRPKILKSGLQMA